MKEIPADQDKINRLAECIRHDPRQTAKEILIPFRFSGRVAVGLAQMDVSGVDEAYFILQNQFINLKKGRSEGKAASGKAFEYITVFSSPARPQGRAPTSSPAILFSL